VTPTPGVTSYQRYYPYGEPRDDYNPALPTDRTFTGQITDGLLDDGGTGLMYYRARYYDPQVGRFAAADTIVPNPGNPQDLNRYTYVGNNPVNGTDPSGHAFIEGLDFSGSYYYWPSLGFLVDSPPPVTDTVTGEVLASANDAMTVSTANALFDDMADEKDILYDYAWDYCFIRNKQMATRIAERGEASFSVFILGSSELSLRTTVREGLSYPGVPQYDPDKNGEADQVWWNWHVARGVYVSTGRGETPDIYVIDPSLFRSKKAVPLQDWIDAMGDPNATVYYRDDDAYGMLLTWNASEAEWIIDDWTEPPEAFPRDSWNAAADECFAAWGCAGVRNVREPGWSWSSY
jgi:RHS repeat-associated protein